MDGHLRYRINLLGDFTVVTSEGEYLGTWGTDETDAIYEFTPDGASEPRFSNVFLGRLCEQIDYWHSRSPPS